MNSTKLRNNILITGANGFIGSHIVRAFCKPRHAKVTALVRPSSDLRFIRRYPIEMMHGDLASGSFDPAQMQNFDTIVHAGGKVGDWGDYQDFYRTNVLGSLALFNATRHDSGFVYISSNAVLGEEDEAQAKAENAERRPVLEYAFENLLPSAMNHYRLSKAVSEMLLIARAKQTGRRLTVIRPVWVFGPREFNAGPYEYCKTVKGGMPLMPGCDSNRFHTIYAGDLANIVVKVSENIKDGINIYNVGNPQVELMTDYWSAFCAAIGVKVPRHIPKWLLYPPAMLMEAVCSLAGTAEPPLFTRARVYMFYASNVYNVSKVIDDYKVDHFTSLEKATRITVRWWRMHGYL
ncbi:MAG: NAD-dependent epimerase/dehydratase family protein [Candidatus Riflebacteria bacterium]|nr:NAD-dependent epimerase/dehydratase family protein [Candidatus Riflebacteria bacterium]